MTPSLTRTEQAVLDYLQQRAGTVVSPEALLRDVWGYEPTVHTRTVQVTIQRLRSKIETDPRVPRRLVTVRGQGYRYVQIGPHEGVPPGRLDLVDEITRIDTRLITLLGPVGVGKSEVLRCLARRADRPVWEAAELESLVAQPCFVDHGECALPALRQLLQGHDGPVVVASRVRLGLKDETIVPIPPLPGDTWDAVYQSLRQRLMPTLSEERDLTGTDGYPFLIRLALELPPGAPAEVLVDEDTPMGAAGLPSAHRSGRAAAEAVMATSERLSELLGWWGSFPEPPPASLLTAADCACLADHGLAMDGAVPRFMRVAWSASGPTAEARRRIAVWAAERWAQDDVFTLAAQWPNLRASAEGAEGVAERQELSLFAAHSAANERPHEAMALLESVREPTHLGIEVLYGMVLLILGRVDEGLAQAQRLQSQLPSGQRAPVRFLQLGVAAHNFAGRHEDAVAFVRQHGLHEGGWERSAAMGMVWKHYSMALLRLQRADEAKVALITGRLRSTGRGRVACTFNLAACELLVGRLDEAERLFEELDHEELPGLLRCGHTLERGMLASIRGQDENAVRLAEAAAAMPHAASWGGEVEISLARVYFASGRAEDALGVLDGLMSKPTRASLRHAVHLWRAVCWRHFALPQQAEAELADVPAEVVELYRAFEQGTPHGLDLDTCIDYGLDAQLLARLAS